MAIHFASFFDHNKNTIASALAVLEGVLPLFGHSPAQQAQLQAGINGVNNALGGLTQVVNTVGDPTAGEGIKGSDVIKAALAEMLPGLIEAAVAKYVAPHVADPVPAPPVSADEVAAQTASPTVVTLAPPEPGSAISAAMGEAPTDHTQVDATMPSMPVELPNEGQLPEPGANSSGPQ